MATPTECINTTHDKAYDYKKSIQKDGTVKYYFIGNFGKYKERFPNWTEAIDDGKWGTIRRNAIVERVKFDCKAGESTSIPNSTPPSSSQTSNIIENSKDPNDSKLYGTVVDEKTLNPIKGANVQYDSLSDVTNDKGEFTIQLPTPEPIKPSSPPPDIPKECINTTHDRAYNYKRLTYRSGKVEYYFIGLYGKYKQNFPNWTLAPPDTLVGKTSGTINRDAIVEKVKFDCPQATFPPLITSSIDTPPTPTDIPSNPTSTLRQIQGSIQFSKEDPLSGVYGNIIRIVKNEVGEISSPPYQTQTDFDGKFQLSIPINSKFLQAKKSGRNSNQTIILPLTQDSNYVFDFTSITNDGIIQEQVETTVIRDRFDLEVNAITYSSKSIPVIKGDGTLKNDLGVIPLKSTKVELIEEKLKTIIITPEEIKEITKDKKDSKHLFKQKLLDLLKKLKILLLPLILSMIAQFGITKLKELLDKGKDEIKDAVCPTPEEIKKLIKRKNQIVKQLNNTLKTIESATKILGISGNVILTLEIAFKILKNLPLPTSVPPGVGLPTNVLLGIQDNKKQIEKTITTLKGVNTSTLIVLNLLRQTIIKVIEYLNILDKLIQHCYQGEDNTEQISAELLALTQEQAEQESPVITIVNGFTMGVETEKTTNSLKRRRATATNAGGVIMLKGEWSFSSIDQILIDELVFYIQINDLKAD